MFVNFALRQCSDETGKRTSASALGFTLKIRPAARSFDALLSFHRVMSAEQETLERAARSLD